jgi:hypothetical protein
VLFAKYNYNYAVKKGRMGRDVASVGRSGVHIGFLRESQKEKAS